MSSARPLESLKEIVRQSPASVLGWARLGEQAYQRGASVEELKALLGRGRAKRGMFEGDLEQGELEISQVSAGLREILPAARIVETVMAEFHATLQRLSTLPKHSVATTPRA